MQSYVLDRLNISAGETGRLTQIKSVLNQTYLQLCAEEQMNTSFQTLAVSANATSLTLPAGTTGIISLQNGVQAMAPITLQEMVAYVAATSAGTAPVTLVAPLLYSYTSPLSIQVWPSPSASVNLTGLLASDPATMVASTDTPTVIPAAWHDLLAEMTIQRIAVSEEDLWPQQLGQEVMNQLRAAFTAYLKQREGDSGALIPLIGYTR